MLRWLMITNLLFFGCSKDYYPWTDSKLPDWAVDNVRNVPSKVLVEQVEFGPVNKGRPKLWCYKYKEVIIIYELDNKGNIWRFTVWKN